jgi:hypothetical protein
MIVPKTHFDQVPLEVIKKLIEQQIAAEEVVEAPDEVKKISSKAVPVALGARNGKGRKS